jgi:hypothetical protein
VDDEPVPVHAAGPVVLKVVDTSDGQEQPESTHLSLVDGPVQIA